MKTHQVDRVFAGLGDRMVYESEDILRWGCGEREKCGWESAESRTRGVYEADMEGGLIRTRHRPGTPVSPRHGQTRSPDGVLVTLVRVSHVIIYARPKEIHTYRLPDAIELQGLQVGETHVKLVREKLGRKPFRTR